MFWMYAGFIALVLVLLALDLGVFHKAAHVVSREGGARLVGLLDQPRRAFSAFIYAATRTTGWASA
jgi:tellurite resistance protein TerC